MIDITKNNEEFARLSNAEKRVVIAQDVLAALKMKNIVATNRGVYLATTAERQGGYMTTSNYNDPILLDLFRKDPDGSFQDEIPNLPVCQVCAKGAIFLCTVAKANQVRNEDVIGMYNFESGKLSDLLGGIFDVDQLELIEGAFENWNEFEGDNVNEKRSSEDRMILIMNNIVRNKGTFFPREDFEVDEDY